MKSGDKFLILRGGKKTELEYLEYLGAGCIEAKLENGEKIRVFEDQIISDNQIELF